MSGGGGGGGGTQEWGSKPPLGAPPLHASNSNASSIEASLGGVGGGAGGQRQSSGVLVARTASGDEEDGERGARGRDDAGQGSASGQANGQPGERPGSEEVRRVGRRVDVTLRRFASSNGRGAADGVNLTSDCGSAGTSKGVSPEEGGYRRNGDGRFMGAGGAGGAAQPSANQAVTGVSLEAAALDPDCHASSGWFKVLIARERWQEAEAGKLGFAAVLLKPIRSSSLTGVISQVGLDG